MTNELVSIIIPVYNVAPYLDNCISSACNQTYSNIEIILVDDGSTDGSGQICDKWAEKDNRIVVIHKKNGGVSSARNAGLDSASGKYIAFLDSDDEYLTDTLAKAITGFNRDAEVVSFGYSIVSKKQITKILFSDKTYQNITEKERFDFIVGPFFRFELGWNVWNNIFLKSIIDEYNLRFFEGHSIAEDQAFCMLYFSHVNRICVLGETLYNYYLREDSLMGSVRENKLLCFGEKNNLTLHVLNHYSIFHDADLFDKHYSVIHYLLLEREIQFEENKGVFLLSELRQKILDDIRKKSDLRFFFLSLNEFHRHRAVLIEHYGILRTLEKTARVKWLLNGNSFLYKLMVQYRKRIKKAL